MNALAEELALPAAGRVTRAQAAQRMMEATGEPAWVRRTLIGLALAFLTLFLLVPLVAVFVQAFAKNLEVY